MHRLLIVDDEPIIADGLYEVFSEIKELNLDVYKAYSGQEAIHWLNRTRIDIVITDIHMPDITGIQLLENIRENWPDCRVVFLTGYNEFDYVYKAIQFQNVSYLLKTEGYKKIIETVKKVLEDIERSLKIEDMVNMAHIKMSKAQELLQREYLTGLLAGRNSYNDLHLQFEQLNIGLNASLPLIVVLGTCALLKEEKNYVIKQQRLYALSMIAEKSLSCQAIGAYIWDDSSDVIWLLQPQKTAEVTGDLGEYRQFWSNFSIFAKGMLEIIQATCQETLNLSTSFFLTELPCVWNDLTSKVSELKWMTNYQIKEEKGIILTDGGLEKGVCGNNRSLSFGKEKKIDTLGYYLDCGMQEAASNLLSELIIEYGTYSLERYDRAVEAYYSAAIAISSFFKRLDSSSKLEIQIDTQKLMRFDGHKSWTSAFRYLMNVTDLLFKAVASEAERRASDAIRVVHKYILGHLNGDLSLVNLADKVYLNPSYLSRLFKQVNGINLSEYINRMRINRAKELLEDGALKIHEIADKVGYNTAPNFTRFFKNSVGMSPQDYREAYQKR